MKDQEPKKDSYVLQIDDGFIDVRAIFDRSATRTIKEKNHGQSRS